MQSISYPRALSCSCVLGAVSGLWSSPEAHGAPLGKLLNIPGTAVM